jgi:hypothetical protein
VEVNVVHCLVQYSTVKHVQVNIVHCHVQYRSQTCAGEWCPLSCTL